MNCEDVRGFLDAYRDDELDPEKRAVVHSHVQACSQCASSLRKIEMVRDEFRDAMPYYKASADLGSRVRVAIRGAEYLERRTARGNSRWQDWRIWGAVAATVTLAVAMSAPFLFRATGERRLIAEELFAAHARALMGHEVDVVSTDRHTVKPWFNGKLPFSPPVSNLAEEGFPLEGGRLDYAAGHPVAGLVYRRALHKIDVFIWPAAAGGLAPPSSNRDGYHEISWTKGGFVFVAVSDVNSAELNRLASLLQSR